GADVAIGETTFINEVKVNETDRSGFQEAMDVAKGADVVIMVLGEHGFMSGEGRSRTNLDIPGVQDELLKAVYSVNPNIVLVLMNGRPLTIDWEAKNLPAIVEAWHLGSQSGNAIAEVLTGAYNPSGKLPMTFPKSVGQIPIYYNHQSTGRPGPIELVFWSHYIDETNDPVYPFGHGLSYTTFEYSALKASVKKGNRVEVTCTVTNTGKVKGEEVAQLYIHDLVASISRPIKELKGFEKFELEPGASKTLTFLLTDKELGFFDGEGNFKVEPGTFWVMVGTSSQEGV
ncbi:MAG: glycoside hydrolase family 3 C-terminal domain-containing protein, partial [Saprospiraceae bacterium]|nr:glycoside hydrolase family 3 C-terminal domain-containing protein [Saprospiraceae bacterium]